MTLESGFYVITSKVNHGDEPIGRNLVEDRSLLPKKIFLLPRGVEDPKVRQLCISLYHHLITSNLVGN